MKGVTCGLDFKYVPPDKGIRDRYGRAFCGESCRAAYREMQPRRERGRAR